ncbi:translation elongation factor eEF1 gamma [Suhomyces tanzawaensis NRRL Y-17324]|uniref:Translation elongation factor eEF1 gamma n=1 Tax=Suhomyces tanzawaensis NRRL Y-17324 TaxID=984487 RepID=A0A1E4SIE1_9ASCO|nr:translation elongation factor eEF1 gamma [Suhomyces tanzawaensis NRRL Y-17324]ODV79265.1 translation elongation factor eEF1 gamma [Suhomyces tanzawaensis NRRL Y-17324]
MSLGTLYFSERTRAWIPKAVIKHFDLDVKIVDASGKDFTDKFPLGKVPAFAGPKGFKLTEVMAITIYLINLADPKSKLLGKNAKEYAEVLRWASITNSELIGNQMKVIKPLLGDVPYNKKNVDEAAEYTAKIIAVFEARLANYTYLVGERLTIADIFGAAGFVRGFQHLYADEWQKKHPNVTRWFKTIINQKILHDVLGDFTFAVKPLEYTPPKKEKKAPAPKKEAAPAKKEAAPAPAADEEPAPAPKPKHPLELLGKPKAALDQWKRVYSNEETRETAIPWFWENQYDTEDWSLWKVDFLYNDELTMTFMSNNLIGGFFNRLSASTKYMFGCMVVYGENNNNGITGFLLVRGQEILPAVDVAPDYESYKYTKLDGSKEEDKKFVNNMLAWDEPVVVNGESREIADGKVFK